ncbi:unnamed protein product [Prorocentrum cordatum]|uniref:Uncharacterized protein n=1 Tax=Prorocentrum cordatum TaxID=2364126 RepID=A0ABN9WA42_9DINO|nr:unnamed protein product [Polarella glacialis]
MKSGDHDCTIVFGDDASLKAGCAVRRGALLPAKRQGRPTRPLFPLKLARHEQLCNEAVADAGLSRLRVTPRRARRGGPSADAARVRGDAFIKKGASRDRPRASEGMRSMALS